MVDFSSYRQHADFLALLLGVLELLDDKRKQCLTTLFLSLLWRMFYCALMYFVFLSNKISFIKNYVYGTTVFPFMLLVCYFLSYISYLIQYSNIYYHFIFVFFNLCNLHINFWFEIDRKIQHNI